jgi:RNA polymerase sigma-70 factor, ECF subfamily
MDAVKVWSEYRSSIKSFLHSRVSNPADVDDLLQEISIKTFNGIGALKDQSTVQSWLFQTAQRTIIDFYRTNGRLKSVHPDDLWYSVDAPETQQALERCLEPFIAALPSEMNELLRAIDMEGQSQKEYAATHGISYSTLKSRVQKARLALRRVFENCCHLSLDTRGNISDYRSKAGACDNC